MAQTTTSIWDELVFSNNVRTEFAFEVNGVWYGPESEIEHSVNRELYNDFGFGNATIASLTLSLIADDIERGATIKRYVRLVSGDTVSEWRPGGVFFTNRRTEDDGHWTVQAFDAMRKAETVWEPDQSLSFPLPMPDAVDEFARIMGVEIDERTTLNASYTIDYPANDYTIRNELQYIAAAHAGNWIITNEGKLLLVPLLSIPAETSNLVTERGAAITFGGVRIIV